MTVRKCSTCKHYEAAPIWRKGWCRNPLLYAPQQSHLVSEDELDCERGMGNYWEPENMFSVGIPQQNPVASTLSGYQDQVLVPHTGREIFISQSGQPVYSVSGSSGYNPDPMDDDIPPPANARTGSPGDRDRNLDYYDGDRYWTDYLRIALPILGVLLLLVLFWFWASSFFGDDDENGDVDLGAGGQATLPLISASPTVVGQAPAAGTPRSVITVSPTIAAGTAGQPSPTQATGGTVGEIAPNTAVVVTNAGPEGVNLRSEPTTAADNVVAVLPEGTQLTVTGESVEAEGFIWWPVSGDTGDGFIVEDYITPAQ